MRVLVLWRLLTSTQLRVSDYCQAHVSFRLDKGGTGFCSCKEYHTAYEILPLHKRKKNNGKKEEAISCNFVDGTGQRVQSLMFMMTMLIPFPRMTISRYPVPSTVLKLWITITHLRNTFPSFDRKLKENWLNLMSAALHCLWFHYQ